MNRLSQDDKVEGGISSTLSSSPPSVEELAQVRQVLYRFFASLFLYPEPERLTKLKEAAVALQNEWKMWSLVPFGGSLEHLLGEVAALPEGQNIPIEEEYLRLFSVKPAAIPYESIYIDPEGLARGLTAAHIDGVYARAGLKLAPDIIEPPDHVAVELEFMAFLCTREVETLEAVRPEEAARSRDSQRVFLAKHLRRWFPEFARRVKKAAPDHLYAAVTEATFAFLHHDLVLFRLHRNGRSS